ncbi:isoaspartyl peptidase/L-asparaginase [Massilia sp. CF038]|uniref:isoaspartyl peptidase/L-asparaginase n=1 Tax=Massilia sp. CF038 TaxID=1881045 RepID=UPI000912FF25|nr:isoaspartyl peptidase/L-asparaginase [Massilia sp. CF038]SHG60873.1 L-asparaginase/beta-aspartyl-peptidase (threonine type) [Massilia sp. CF038]
MRTSRPECAIVVHGGAGAGSGLNDGCIVAADAARCDLNEGGAALSAAVAAVVSMENDGRFNAGTGAALGLDGKTIEMDACVMDTQGRLGAVTLLRGVKNPVLVARQIADTPHCLIGGEGAVRFARAMGHAPYDKVSEHARQQYREMMAKLESDDAAMPGVANGDFLKFWNYADAPRFRIPSATDTVGAVVRDHDGGFAVAGSTGGSAPSLLGRVGDTPLVGCGFYAGTFGAVAATGVGEYMIRTLLAVRVYHWISEGVSVAEALARGIALFPADVPVGLIAVSATEAGACANADMPHAIVRGTAG